MYKYLVGYSFSFLFSLFFFLSPACNSAGQKQASIVEKAENRLPTRRELRGAFRSENNFTFVYPNDEKSAAFYESRVTALNNNERLELKVKGISIAELTEDILKNDIVFFVGHFEPHPLLSEIQTLLPVELKEKAFVFDKKSYHSPHAIFKLFPYPNPYNQQLPIYLLTGNDNEVILQFLQNNYPDDLSQMLNWSWSYEVQERGELKVMGYLNESTWQLDKKAHFDFTGANDTILQTTHFRFMAHSSPLSKTEIEAIAEKCEQTFSTIMDFTEERYLAKKIDYHFYPSVEKKALQIANMQEASTNLEENRVDVVMNDYFKGSSLHPENKLLLRHTLGKPYVLALEEGLANRFTQNWQKKGYRYWTKKLCLSDNLPTLKELITNDIYQKESYLVMGAMAGTFVDFLIDKFGKKTFLHKYNVWEYEDFITLEDEWNHYLTQITQPTSEEKKLNQQAKLPYLKGFNFAHEGYRIYNGYGSNLAKESLHRIEEIGGNAIAIVPYSYMRDPEKPSYIPIIQSTGGENDQAVLFAHYEAKNRGMSTMLKPQIWVGRSWPGDIKMNSEKDWATFFENYYRWIRHYALLAEINEFDSYCMGVEFAKATLAKEQEWRKMIRKIKGIYSGQLTYAANWGEEFENLTFWDELDFIGLNCYYPLSKSDNPSKRALTKSFAKVMDKIETVSYKFNKPIVFTEIGFRSVDGPWKNPHAKEDGRAFNDKHQKMCYEVVLESIKNKKWCKGILWWKWPSHLSYRGKNNKGFSPNSKQTEIIIEKYFKTKN